ncbi:ABC transporter permease [Nitrospina watsonii]|uniref:ABC transporter permease n=1 Tax=Nitrospina watsonii TaxID=1323948 RepID=A0ABM9HFW1_9BACT|nr:FtsX-like permease family protein [Nitrospina watsonii]CAI2719055.1 conserved membrane protein of unknown function [Nitrospina watsonii]
MRDVVHFKNLFGPLIVRPLWRDPFRFFITIVGVSLGVAVFLSIQLANRQTLSSFTETVDLMLGRANAVIHADGVPFDETYFKRLLPLRDTVKAYPVIEGYGVETGSQEVVEILGTDLLQDSGIRDFSLKTADDTLQGLLPLILDPRGIIIPETFIPERHFKPGDAIEFLINGQPVTLTLTGVLESKGLARAFKGNVALMDIAAAQSVFGKIGQLDRIDVRFLNDKNFDRMQSKIAAVLPEFLHVDRPQHRSGQVEKMLRAFQYNLTALSFIALLVGLYLIYNMISLSVVRRRTEIGTLRALGASPYWIAALFILEAGVIGAIGSAFGVALGYGLAKVSLQAITLTVQNLYVSANVADFDFHWSEGIPYFMLGVGLSLGSALIPAYDAARTSPTWVMRRGSYDLKVFRGNRRLTALGIGCLALAAVCANLPAIGGFPWLGFASVFLVILGMSCLAPGALVWMRDGSHRLCKNWFGGEGLLASRNLTQNVGRNAIAVSSLAIAFMMVISMSIMVHSFRQTVTVWIDQTLKADLFVRAAGGKHIDYQYALPVEPIADLKQLPGVKAVDAFRALHITYNDQPAILGSGDFEVLSRHGNLVIKDGPPARDLAALMVGADRAIVSEPFAYKHGVGVGDRVTLETPNGTMSLEIVAVYYDYSQERGYAIVDRRTFLKYYEDPTVNSFVVYLEDKADLPAVRKAILKTIGASHRVIVRSYGELKEEVLRIFDKTFAITYSLEIIGVGVALLGLFNTLVALIIERRREMAVLRFIGAYPQQLRRMVWIEAGLLGWIGSLMGLVAGVVVSYILIFVINKQAFGWTIQIFHPLTFMLAATVFFWVVAAVAGLYPARLATQQDPRESIRVE